VFRDAEGRPVRVAGTLADVDARKTTEAQLAATAERLRRSSEMFTKVFRSCPVPILIARTGGRGILDVNDATLAAMGFTREEMIGRSGVDLGLWDVEQREDYAARLAREGSLREVPVEIDTPRGRRSMLLSAEIIVIADEPHYLLMGHDITNWFEAEARVKASEERWRRLSEAAFEGIAVTHEGRLLDANEQLPRLLGYSLDEMIGLSVQDLVAPESREEVSRRAAERSVEPYEHAALRKDGTRVPVEVRGQFFRQGDRVLRVTSIRDVTHRKHLEAELRAAAREWNECFDAMPMGLVVADREGRIERANRRLLEMSGAAAFRDLIGRTLVDVGPHEPWPTLMRCAMSAGGAVSAEVGDALTGTAWRVAWSDFPRQPGEPRSTILVVRDVTEEMQLRDELRRQETLAAMGSLVAGVAHEVRTPLFSISAALDAFEGGSPDELEEGGRLLRAQVKRLGNLMSDLLDYGKPPELHLERGGVGDIVERALRTCGASAAEAGVVLTTDIPAVLPTVPRDARRIEQAFENLVANAIQHSPRGGRVRVVVEGARAGDGLECRVEDDGPGIPESARPRLFEPVFTKRKGGTGLGLPIVQRIVESHGGRVSAANRAAGGAVFTFTLPAAAALEDRRG
jgi:PAS domain S-box-containing protein